VFQIGLPPLRERREDIALLAQHFIEKLSRASGRRIEGLTADALSHLKVHSWPGNIRELRNTLERAVVLCDGSWITKEHLPLDFDGLRQQAPTFQLPFGLTLDEVEKEYLLKTLARNGNNKARTADLLGISEKTLYNKLHRYQSLNSHPISGRSHTYIGAEGHQNLPK
jgi:DNA-binding NtrC family response regulator